MPLVMIVDDEPLQREIISTILEAEGYESMSAASGEEALKLISKFHPDVLLIDLKMEGMDGIELMERVPIEPFTPSMILMTAHGTVSSAVKAMKKGALDYLTKPLDKGGLMLAVERAAERTRLLKENSRLRRELMGKFQIEGIVGKSPLMRKALDVMEKVSAASVTVLISGESGTGKELVARAIHYNSQRKANPFMVLNCAAIPETLFESELFGYEPGAFTGAVSRKEGLIELSEGGTLLLDEIGELPLSVQSKLLRVLQDREVRRIGGKSSHSVDVRFIASTNKDLQQETSAGKFREDLFYRLAVVRIELPPLKQRMEDLPELVRYFIAQHSGLYGRKVQAVDDAAMKALLSYHWPGNIRQLGSVIERAVLLSESGTITLGEIKDELRDSPQPGAFNVSIPEDGLDFDRLERDLIFGAMDKAGGVATRAAKLLGMSYKTFVYRLEKHRSGQISSQISGHGNEPE